MALVDELLAAQTSRRGPDCSIGVALQTLPAAIDAAELEAVIDNPLIRYTTLSAWAKAHGIEMKPEALSRHRNRTCRCRS